MFTFGVNLLGPRVLENCQARRGIGGFMGLDFGACHLQVAALKFEAQTGPKLRGPNTFLSSNARHPGYIG